MNQRLHSAAPQIRLSLRAAFCLSAPLIVGLIINQRVYAIVFSIGALWAISQDGLDEWGVRGPRLLGVAVAAGAGATIGATTVGVSSSGWALTILFGVMALIAGFIEASNWATPGAYLLIGTIVGAGLQFSGKVWQSCLALFLGALWVYFVAALTDYQRRLSNQRIFLANAFDSLAQLINAVGTSRFYELRAKAVVSLDAAQDVVGSSRIRKGNPEEVALHQSLIVALRSGEVVSYLEGKELHVDPSVPAALHQVANSLRASSGLEASALLEGLQTRFSAIEGLDPKITAALAPTEPSQLRASTLRGSSRASTRARLPIVERVRFACILALAISVGTIIAHSLDGPHGFWLPLSVAFILRPDLGPVMTRALARTVGTIIGVSIAAIVVWMGNSIAVLIVLSCVMAALVPWSVKRSHLLAVVTFTPIVFVFLSLLGADKYLLVPRIIDTALGATIVLSLDLFLWSTAPSLRPTQQLEKARNASARYGREATRDDVIRRHLLRRSALRAVANARSSLAQAKAEPHPLRRPDSATAAELDEIEASIDAHTVSLLEGTSS